MSVALALASDLHALARIDAAGRPTAEELVLAARAPIAAAVAGAIAAAAPAVSSAAPLAGVPAAVEDAVLDESVAEELERLHSTLASLNETNDRIMAQNIALLADLEAAHKAVRELRSEKDALAVQLKRLLP